MNKKNIILPIIIIAVILTIILSLFLILSKSNVNLEEVEKALLKEGSELNLRKLDREDISKYFGISIIDNDDDVLFITDFNESDKPFSPNILIVIINNRNYQEYSSILKNYLDVEINNATDYDRIKLYQDTIIKQTRNYFYLVLGDNKDIIKVINKYYK